MKHRFTVLSAAVDALPAEWTTGRAWRLYRAAGLATKRRTARRDLARLAAAGRLTPVGRPVGRAYTRTPLPLQDGRS
ncbi:hypothetical protein ACPCJU_16825 [Streptomyces thermodiastaticus]